MGTPKNPALFFGGIAVAIIAIAISLYYILPGDYYRALATHDLTSPQPLHAVAFAVVAIACILFSVINRPRSNA